MSFCNGWQLAERLRSTESTASKLWACSALKGQLSKPLPPRLSNIVKRGREDCKCQRLSCYEVVSSRQDGPIRPAQNQVSQIPSMDGGGAQGLRELMAVREGVRVWFSEGYVLQ